MLTKTANIFDNTSAPIIMQSETLINEATIMTKVTKQTAVANIAGNAVPPVAKKGGVNAISKTTLRDSEDHAIGVKFEFSNGKSFELLWERLGTDIQSELICHGIAQKVGDAAAKSQGTTIEEKFDACNAVYERLMAGDWAAKRENAGEGVTGGLLAKAIAEVTGKPIDTVREFLKGLTKDQRDAMTRDATIKPVYERLRAEREAAKSAKAPNVDTGSLLAGLLK